MITTAISAVIGAAIGWRFGIFEADWAKARADDRVYDPLPHPLLLVVRMALAAMIAICIDGAQLSAICIMVAVLAPLASAHRMSYNRRTRTNGLARTRAWYYMGPCRRRIGDSGTTRSAGC